MIAGVVFLFFTPGPAFLGTSIMYVASIAVLFRVASGWVAPEQESPRFWAEFRAGVSYVWQRPGMRLSVVLAAAVAFFAAPEAGPRSVACRSGKRSALLCEVPLVTGPGLDYSAACALCRHDLF